MVEKLLQYEDLSPLLPKNETLTDFSMEDYEKAMDKWVEYAQTTPYVKEAASSNKMDSAKRNKIWAEVVETTTE